MSDWTLYRGNKNYSSWSMRGWLALTLAGPPFREVPFDLSAPGVRDEVRRRSPTGRVPSVQHGDLLIWDSLAIFEYLAEQFPDARLWPDASDERAIARSVSAEMHSGFPAIRSEMPMNIRRSCPGKGRTDETMLEADRIMAIWRDCRSRFGKGGDYLFGEWTLADVMYAPVVSRFRTYAVEVDGASRAYMDRVWSRPDIGEWRAAAEAEPMVLAHYDLLSEGTGLKVPVFSPFAARGG